MSTDLSSQSPMPFKNRRGWLVGFGVIQILIACSCLLFMALTAEEFVTSNLASRATSAPVPGPTDFLAMLVCGGLGPLFLILGVGSIKCKNWARIASQIVSVFWLLIGVPISLFFMFVVPRVTEPRAWLQPEELRLVTIVMGFIMVVVPATLLVFYSLKSVRATCRATGLGRPQQ